MPDNVQISARELMSRAYDFFSDQGTWVSHSELNSIEQAAYEQLNTIRSLLLSAHRDIYKVARRGCVGGDTTEIIYWIYRRLQAANALLDDLREVGLDDLAAAGWGNADVLERAQELFAELQVEMSEIKSQYGIILSVGTGPVGTGWGAVRNLYSSHLPREEPSVQQICPSDGSEAPDEWEVNPSLAD